LPKKGDVQINSFTKGLITEVSPLSFPEGASLDELNMKLKKDGTRERRLGMDYESGYGTKDTGLSAEVLSGARMTAYRWSLANGQAHTEIGVIQAGNALYFIDLLTSNPSANYLNGGNPITGAGIDNAAIMGFATINNYLLVISSGFTNPLLFSYNKETDVITYETAEIMVRDLWGVNDNLGENDRPNVLTPEHHYNLLNQGWDNTVVTTCGAGINAIQCTFNTFGIYPGNGDQWSIGRVEDLTSADVDKYNPNIAARNLVNTGQVAKGHFILPLFFRGQSRVDQTGLTLKADQELGRLTSVASYAGRAFYSGILSRVNDGDNRSPSLSGVVFFSQTFIRKVDLIKCYQEADPTNPDFNEVIDTDGGYIVIPECSVINALKPIKQSLFVFAENGVWEIRGDEGGFRATSYQVNKISNIGVYSPKSIIEVNGVIYFWGNSGVYAITPNQFGTFDTNNITLQTIQRLYNSIPDSAKRNARGYHDNHTNTVRWLYYSGEEHQVGSPVEVVSPPAPVTQIGETQTLSTITANDIDCIAFNPTYSLVVYRNTVVTSSNRPWMMLFDTSTIIPVNYTPVQLSTITCNQVQCNSIDSTRTLALYIENNGGNFYVRGRVVSISGTTITPGTEYGIKDLTTQSGVIHSVGISDTQSIILYTHSTFVRTINARIIDISGTVLSLGTELVVESGASLVLPYISKLDSTRFLCTWGDGSNVRACILTKSGSTLSAGTISNIGTYTNSGNTNTSASSTLSAVVYNDATSNKLGIKEITSSGSSLSSATLNTNTLIASQGDGVFITNDLLVYIYQNATNSKLYMNSYYVGATGTTDNVVEQQIDSVVEPNRIATSKVQDNKLLWVGVSSSSSNIYTQLITAS